LIQSEKKLDFNLHCRENIRFDMLKKVFILDRNETRLNMANSL